MSDPFLTLNRYEVSDIDPMRSMRSSWSPMFLPASVDVVVYHSADDLEIEISGPVLCRGGRLSPWRTGIAMFHAGDKSDWPEWLVQLVGSGETA